MSTTIKHRRGSSAGWTLYNPVLAEGEIGVEIDTGRFKLGDGRTEWNTLPYFTPGVGGGAVPTNLGDLADVTAALDTPPGRVLATTSEGRWEPVEPPHVDPNILIDLRADVDLAIDAFADLKTEADLNAEKIGDTSLLDFGVPEHDLVHYLIKLESRINALAETEVPTSEGALEVDNYSNGFIRVRDTSGILDDGLVHSVHLVLATVPGPGGVVITDPPGVPASTANTWFDHDGTLGPVVGATGANVSQTTLRNWVKYGNPSIANHYLLWVRLDTTSDPAHPRLVVEKVASIA